LEPIYMNENRYSYLVGSWKRPASTFYADETPEAMFEKHLRELFLKGQTHLQHEEYMLALHMFQEAMMLILRTVHPIMPLDSDSGGQVHFPNDETVVDSLVSKTTDMLLKMKPVQYAFPAGVMSERSMLSGQTQQELKGFTEAGLHVTSFQAQVMDLVRSALNAVIRRDWKGAIESYNTALDLTPAPELAIRGGILHDMAVLSEKADDRQKALELAQLSIDSFSQATIPDAQAQAIATTTGILERSGSTQQADEFNKRLENIRASTNLNDIVTLSPASSILFSAMPHTISPSSVFADPAVITPQSFSLSSNAPELMGLKYIADSTTIQKNLTINGLATSATITLDNRDASANTGTFLKTLSDTEDIGLLTNWSTPVQFIAYVPHIYFYVIPMSIGDCYAGIGNLEQACQSYLSVLNYPFINKNVEITKVWTRLARTFLDLGDQAYRNAKDNVAAFNVAKTFYEKIILVDNTVDISSPLYKDAKFSGIKMRVEAMLSADDPTVVEDNPSILNIVIDAQCKLQQIQIGLNFFGLGPDYISPFNFEYLQNSARYFAQHASQTEQHYIHFKSQAENEEMRREQLSQQAEVARASAILERRGVTEAQRGIDGANASFTYASTQLESAIESLDRFGFARWELLELSELEAWASASAVDKDKQVKLTISDYEYFSADHESRNSILRSLAYQRTRLSHQLESDRLDNAVKSAKAYQAVAQNQVSQAQARLKIAEQRVKIAELQQRFAEENRDFLDMREFGVRLWYELAQQAKRLKQRYLDMATQIAFLMERAYNAETERGLNVIRYDYQNTASGNLMGADILLTDVDSFTFDYITTTKTKKIPVKKTIRMADSYPMQFYILKTTGKCSFETRFSNFDREHPGLYLAKIRNVELVFVGITGATSIAGSLRNIGVSRFRVSDGSIIERLYSADVMILSQYEIRHDSLAFRFNPNDLHLFENNGIETFWQLDLPLDANDFDFSEILDIHLIIYYDGFFDSGLETRVKTHLPPSGSASCAFSMKLSFPDELYFLKNQSEAELIFEPIMFPRNQKDLKRTTSTLKVTGQPMTVQNLTLRLITDTPGGELILKTDSNGEVIGSVPGSPMHVLEDKAVLGRWQIVIRSTDNPHLVQNGVINLSGLDDLLIFFEYSFNYR
jgi:hypothetical protein